MFANRQLQLSDAAQRDRLAAADQQLRQLGAELDSSAQRISELESAADRSRDTRSRDTERQLTGRCGELSAEIAEWKCRLDDALRLAKSKESELRRAAADHVTDVDRWSEKVEQLMSRNCELETAAADGKRELMDAELRESLLRQNAASNNTAQRTR